MFTPIIHNLKQGQAGYSECQLYNKLIKSKPQGDMLLAKKVHLHAAWKRLCQQALKKAQQSIH